jgi:hypothetical protein
MSLNETPVLIAGAVVRYFIMQSDGIIFENVKRSLIMPLSRLRWVLVTPCILSAGRIFSSQKDLKSAFLFWMLGNILFVSSLIIGWWIGNLVNVKRARRITAELSAALKQDVELPEFTVAPAEILFKVGFRSMRNAFDTNQNKISVLCHQRPDETFKAMLWPLNPSKKSFLAVPILASFTTSAPATTPIK